MSRHFVHLRLHSEYSLLDGTLRIEQLVAAARERALPALALTDTMNLFAAIKFYRAAEAAGIKPILGADLWIEEEGDAPWRATALCLDEQGFRALSRLLSRAYLEQPGRDPARIRTAWLEELGGRLILLLGEDSVVGHLLLRGRPERAAQALAELDRRFPDRLYLAIGRTGDPAATAFEAQALALARRLGIPPVAHNEVRFLDRADHEAHEVRVAIARGELLAERRARPAATPEQFLKSGADMRVLFADLPEAVDNALEIAVRCNAELRFGLYALPAFPTPEGTSEVELLRRKATAGLEARLQAEGFVPAAPPERYQARLEEELSVIERMGFSGYFLIVADFIGWARAAGIPVGPGRGSGAGSLVAWALAITDLDPLRFDLLFERFLNPERVSMPDFDIDFCMERRDEVIEYVVSRYGRERVCQIITFGSMAAKAAVRDVGRVLGLSYGMCDAIAKLIPNRIGITLADALGRGAPELASPELIEQYAREEEVRALIDLAQALEGLVRNPGRHAGGVVIAPGPLTDFTPLYGESPGSGAVTQFDKDDLEKIGLVKFDFLGLRTLTILDWAVQAVNARRPADATPLRLERIPLDDPATFRLIQEGRTVAVFQLESAGMRRLAMQLKPDCFEDLIALVALFRPGPLESGMAQDFIDRKHGRVPIRYPHPALEPILKPTYGTIVYQEQVMQIAQVLAGYSLGGADLLRRAMGKKDAEEMARQREGFVRGAEARGVERALASEIFDQMEKFARYGFNKSHSAAYALLAYQTAWLKAHHPAAFMAAVLSSDMDDSDALMAFVAEARELGLTLDPPDLNRSGYRFEAVDDTRIRFGLGAIKGVGRALCEEIVGQRERDGPYQSLVDVVLRLDPARLNRRALEVLIKAGALDGLGRRSELLGQLDAAITEAERQRHDRLAGQGSLFAAEAPAKAPASASPSLPADPLERRLSWEREALGFYLSGHPVDVHADLLGQLCTHEIGKLQRGEYGNGRSGRPLREVALGGLVADLRRRNDGSVFFVLEDGRGRIEASVFREKAQEWGAALRREAIVVVEGELRPDEFRGPYALRARRLWSLPEACEAQARLLEVEVAEEPADFALALEKGLSPWSGGRTPVRIVLFRDRFRVALLLGEPWRVRADPALLAELRALPGIREVRLSLDRLVSQS